MTNIRKNVWELGGDWASPILWYARGVKLMKERALSDHTSWSFFAAIHGFNSSKWRAADAWMPSEPMPSAAEVKTYWNQCQHGSWYFLPWHRGYLIALEQAIRDAISKVSGAPADWALPYWNYFKPQQNKLPPAFASPDWPDGHGDNPLYVPQRYGLHGTGGEIVLPLSQITIAQLGDSHFTGPGSGGNPGFGGVKTRFSHSGRTHGGVETQPHDIVHVLTGGSPPKAGLMSDPDTAALDPIFWLHHANIDRLWEVWREHPASNSDPTDATWLNGPASVGAPAFEVPLPGGAGWTYTPADLHNLSKLDYTYDDLSEPAGVPHLSGRLQHLGASSAIAQSLAGRMPLPEANDVELMGANSGSLLLAGGEAKTSVKLDAAVRNKVAHSLRLASAAVPAPPDRVFLNLENVRGEKDGVAFTVYVNRKGENHEDADHLAGTIGLFGLSNASAPNGEHAGDGLGYTLEITHIVDAMHLAGGFDVSDLDVRIAPLQRIPDDAQVTIGRISVYRQKG